MGKDAEGINHSLRVSSPLCILELSRLTCVERAVEYTTIIVIYKVLVYIQMSQPTTCFGLFYLGHLQFGYLSQRKKYIRSIKPLKSGGTRSRLQKWGMYTSYWYKYMHSLY